MPFYSLKKKILTLKWNWLPESVYVKQLKSSRLNDDYDGIRTEDAMEHRHGDWRESELQGTFIQF